ncbi:MAG TPA: hypothetical protein PK537_12465, partial [Candidatus Limiplasma sp.]|nr:hypothetical protein [Candidatus Limiplasma sp.]
MQSKRFFTLLFTVIFLFSTFPLLSASAGSAPSITLGAASYVSGTYYFKSAIVNGTDIRTLMINFTDSVNPGDEIILPAVTPTGFTVSATSASNPYSKTINIVSGTLTSVVQAYIRAIGIRLAGSSQTVQFTVTVENITHDTFYYEFNGHYYQYIPYPTNTSETWTSAYDAAKALSYMGRTGYLATITSLEEDEFVNSLSGGKTGWLGGTYMKHSDTGTTLYYDSFDVSTTQHDPYGWYWACGPEKGNVFYTVFSISSLPGTTISDKADAADQANIGNYYNWTRPLKLSQDGQYEPNNAYTESCLTTLDVVDGEGVAIPGKWNTDFSWNNLPYDRECEGSDDMYAVRGYFVEYGDQTSGDTGTHDTAFAIDNATLYTPHAIIETVTPQTGDSSHIWLYWTLASVAAAGIAILAIRCKK